MTSIEIVERLFELRTILGEYCSSSAALPPDRWIRLGEILEEINPIIQDRREFWLKPHPQIKPFGL